jgi:DNA-binding IclR family transcriptional regulator
MQGFVNRQDRGDLVTTTLASVEELIEDSTEGTLASSASKVLMLLDFIAQAKGRALGVSDLAATVGMPKSTTHRLLKALEGQGFVGRMGPKYRLGPRFLELGGLGEATRWSEYDELRDLAVEPIEWLFERVACTVHLAVLEGHEVLYIEKVTGVGGLRIPSRVGGRMPATCTALGKAMLAFSTPQVVVHTLRSPLPRVTAHSIVMPRLLIEQLAGIRATGVAHEYEESRLGLSCLAAPVLQDGQAVAAISVSDVNSTADRSSRYADLVAQAAATIGLRLSQSRAVRG